MHNPETFKQIKQDRNFQQSRGSQKSSQYFRQNTLSSQKSFRQTMQETFNRPLTRQLNQKLKEKNLESTFYQTFLNSDMKNTSESGFYNNLNHVDTYQSFSEYAGIQTPAKKHNILTFGLEANSQYNKIKTEKLIFEKQFQNNNNNENSKENKEENFYSNNYALKNQFKMNNSNNSTLKGQNNRFNTMNTSSSHSLQTIDSLNQKSTQNKSYRQPFQKPQTTVFQQSTTNIPPINSQNNKYLTTYVKQPSSHLSQQDIRKMTEEQLEMEKIQQGNLNPYAEFRKRNKQQKVSKYQLQNISTQNGWYQRKSLADNKQILQQSSNKKLNNQTFQISQKGIQDSTMSCIDNQQNNSLSQNTIIQLNNINIEQQTFFSQFTDIRKMLWVTSDNFETVHNKNGLKYSYFPIPCSERFIRQNKAIQDFKQILKDIKIRLKLQTDKLYAYLKDGTIVNSHLDIPESENIIIINLTPYYKGIDSLSKNRENVLNILNQLEEPLILLQELSQKDLNNTTALKIQDDTISNNNKSSHYISKMNSINPQQILRQQSSISENYLSQDINQTYSQSNMTKYRITNQRQKQTIESQLAKKFKSEINTIIQILNQPDPQSDVSNDGIQEEDSLENLSDVSDIQLQQEIFQKKLTRQMQKKDNSKDQNKNYLKQQLLDDIDMPSEALEKVYKKIQNNDNQQRFDEIIDGVQKEVSQKYKISKKMQVLDKQKYMGDQNALIPSKTVKKFEKIVDYYENELKECSFHETEVEDQPNKITEQILNKNLIKEQQQQQQVSEIRQIADELGIFKKEPMPKKIRLFDDQEQQSLHEKFHPKPQMDKSNNKKQKMLDDNIDEGEMKQIRAVSHKKTTLIIEKSKTSQHMSKKYIERKKYQIVKQISEMIQEFLSDQTSQIKSLKDKIKDKKKKFIKEQEEILQTSSEEEEGISKTVSDDSGSLDDYDVNEEGNQSVEINFDDEDEEEVKHMKSNKLAITSKKEIIREIHEQNKMLMKKNIPQILIDIPELTQGKSRVGKQVLSNFSRFDIHQIFIIYKALHQVTSQRYNIGDYNIDNGMDKEVYRNGLYQIFMQCDELADDIFNTIDFNYSGWMDWGEFLKLMVIIRAKSLAEKINLFIRIADKNGDGMLEKDEIYGLAKACLGKYIKGNENDAFLNEICEYFTRLIFEVCDVDINDEIPLKLIRKAVIKGQHPDNTLLCMFCGADI